VLTSCGSGVVGAADAALPAAVGATPPPSNSSRSLVAFEAAGAAALLSGASASQKDRGTSGVQDYEGRVKERHLAVRGRGKEEKRRR